MNKSASAPLRHLGCPSWWRLGVDVIVCLPIPQISGFKFFGWCRRGGGGDPIRCVDPPALSSLITKMLAPTSWWSRKDVLSRSTHSRLSAYVTDRRWCILC
jgi:hypothetical protein